MTTLAHALIAVARRLAAPAALGAVLLGSGAQVALAEDMSTCVEPTPVVCELTRGEHGFFLEDAEPVQAEEAAPMLVDGHVIPAWAFDATFDLELVVEDAPAWAYDDTFDLDQERGRTEAVVVVSR